MDAHTGTFVDVIINGQPLRLKVQLDQERSVTLNARAAARAGLGNGQGKITMEIGPIRFTGRFAARSVHIAGKAIPAKINWYERPVTSAGDGVISPGLLPFDRVIVRTGAPEGKQRYVPFETQFDEKNGISFNQKIGRHKIAVRFSLERERSNALAAPAAVIAKAYGGEIGITSAAELIAFGARRPVRELRLQQPLLIGELVVHSLWAREFDFSGDHKLPTIPQTPDGSVVVIGKLARQVPVYRLTIGRDILKGCTSYMYERRTGLLTFECQS